MRVGGQRHAPAALPPGKETRYPLYRRPGGPQGRSGRVRKVSSPPGFDPRTFQLVANRHTDWAIAAHYLVIVILINYSAFLTAWRLQILSSTSRKSHVNAIKCPGFSFLKMGPLVKGKALINGRQSTVNPRAASSLKRRRAKVRTIE